MNIKQLMNLCPYTHVFLTIKAAIRERKIPQNSRTGLIIALLGVFCPLFWVPFLMGKPIDELWFDIIHSSLFVVAGIALFLWGIAKAPPR